MVVYNKNKPIHPRVSHGVPPKKNFFGEVNATCLSWPWEAGDMSGALTGFIKWVSGLLSPREPSRVCCRGSELLASSMALTPFPQDLQDHFMWSVRTAVGHPEGMHTWASPVFVTISQAVGLASYLSSFMFPFLTSSLVSQSPHLPPSLSAHHSTLTITRAPLPSLIQWTLPSVQIRAPAG